MLYAMLSRHARRHPIFRAYAAAITRRHYADAAMLLTPLIADARMLTLLR